MACQLILSEEELKFLDRLVRQEIDAGYPELRRTRNPDFRAALERRKDLAEHILYAIGQAEAESDVHGAHA